MPVLVFANKQVKRARMVEEVGEREGEGGESGEGEEDRYSYLKYSFCCIAFLFIIYIRSQEEC
jgi:hypothetical protein